MTAPAVTETATAAALTAAYLAATTTLRAQLAAMVAALFGAQGYRDAGATAYAATAGPVMDVAQQTMAGLTDAYLSHLVGTAPAGVAADWVTGAALRGVDPTELLRRPFVQTWTDLAQGKDIEAAAAAGARRAESIAVTDLQLARTHTARQVLSASPSRVIGYRRELGTDPHHCALCLLTSSRTYHKAELMPLHPGCFCSVQPVFAGETTSELDPTAVHDAIRAQLGDRYVEAGGRGPVDYRQIVITHDHGELGPVLAVAGQAFTGPADISGGG